MTTVNLTINNQSITVPKGTTVYHASQQLEIDLPIFCYHDRMPPFGACRVCLVEVEKMEKPQASCTLEATEGMIVHTDSPGATQARQGILELLLINHPLDCPVCDRGGECPLQDQTVKFGPGKSRFFEEKRHFTKALPLGPVLMLDRERCIACARCTRFGDEIAGDHALEFKERGHKIEVGTPDNESVKSKFIGNTIMICPVGALTSQVYRFRARPWDNDSTPTTCTLCPVGCSMTFDARDGEIMRTRSRLNPDINDIWLCDKGWFGYEFTSHPDRLTTPLIRRSHGRLEPATFDEALDLIAKAMVEAKKTKKVAGLGGNPLTVEENYLFQKLFRDFSGVNHLDHRVGMAIHSLAQEGIAPGMEITIGECETLSSILLLGVDLTEEFPVIWLRLKQAINQGAKSLFIGHYTPEISRYLSHNTVHSPGKELEFLSKQRLLIEEMIKGEKCAIFIGRQYLDSPHRKAILSELLVLKEKHPHLSINLLEGSNNSMGARFAGMHPELGPMGEAVSSPGLNATEIIETTAREGWDLLWVSGADPAAKYPPQLWEEARSKLGCLIVQDLFLTATAKEADIVLPTLSYAEKEGHFVNISGHFLPIHPGKNLPAGIYSDGEIFALTGHRLGLDMSIDSKLIRERIPQNRPIQLNATPVPITDHDLDHLAIIFAPALFDQGNRMQHNPHLSQLIVPRCARINPLEAMKRQFNNHDLITFTDEKKEIVSLPLLLDEGVPLSTIVVSII